MQQKALNFIAENVVTHYMKTLLILTFVLFKFRVQGQRDTCKYKIYKGEKLFQEADVYPEFQLGFDSLLHLGMKRIYNNREVDSSSSTSGFLGLIISENGKLEEVRLLRGNLEVDKIDFWKVFKEAKDWTPANCLGENVRYSYNFPIRIYKLK